MMKNDLLLRALRREEVSRPPVWMMRQAGRYLPEYQVLRKKYDFFTRVQTPELACEITLQPIDIVGPDAAIIFSDILVIPQAMGMTVLMEEGKGPLLPETIRDEHDIQKLNTDVNSNLSYVFDALRLTRKTLDGRVPLIGFAGAPFTLLCYMVEGKGSKGFEKAKAFCFTRPDLAAQLLQKITDATIAYLKEQVNAGAQVIQVFDSWSGMLAPADFDRFAAPYLLQIADAVHPSAPVILFPKGSAYALEALSLNPAVSGIGLDWTVKPQTAREQTKNRVTLQGNYDPIKLLQPAEKIQSEVQQMIRDFGAKGYIANLGHGILPHIPVEHARAFVEAVKNFKG
jgi:uroporphyrinogen decarboxylase